MKHTKMNKYYTFFTFYVFVIMQNNIISYYTSSLCKLVAFTGSLADAQ